MTRCNDSTRYRIILLVALFRIEENYWNTFKLLVHVFPTLNKNRLKLIDIDSVNSKKVGKYVKLQTNTSTDFS